MYYVILDSPYSEIFYDDIEKWCKENLIELNALSMYTRRCMVFEFINETEAAAFKLRWS